VTKVTWGPREPPLPAAGAVAEGAAARAMATRLCARTPESLARLRGVVVGADVLVVLGEAGDLPWVEGARYLGRDPLAPSLWLPTTRAPQVSVALFERALSLAQMPPGRGPLAVLLDPPRLVPLAAARPIARDRLVAWLAGAS
jgi:hypothetical protein